MRYPGAGRKRKINLTGKADVLQSQLPVIDLAQKYNVSRDTIYKLIRDRHKPNLNFIA